MKLHFIKLENIFEDYKKEIMKKFEILLSSQEEKLKKV
jgi:hypothetical protein